MKVIVKHKKNGGTLKRQSSGNNWSKVNLKVTPRKTDQTMIRTVAIPRRVQRRA